MFAHQSSRTRLHHTRHATAPAAKKRRTSTRTASCERLEDRTLMTVLTINGTAGNDYISISGSGGALMTIDVNAVITHYNPNDFTGVVLNGGAGGSDIFNIISDELPVTVTGAGPDTVTVGDTNGVQDITAPLTITDPPNYASVTVDDSADAVGRTATISNTSITGLAPAAINYVSGDLSSLTINGGVGGNTFTVTTTPAGLGLLNTPTDLNSGTGNDHVNVQGTASATTLNVQGQNGDDTVNIGNAGSVQGILGTVNAENTSGFNAFTVDDSADATARTVTLSSFVNPSDSESNGDLWGQIAGLAPAAINYEYPDTSSATIKTGSGGATVNVLGTGTTTNLVGAAGGTVNVGNAGSVQGINGTLNIEDPPSFNVVNVNDSADATARTVTLSSFVNSSDSESNTDQWGQIAGLAPAPINYEYFDTSNATIKTGTGGATVNVLGTGTSTNLIGAASGTVNVGNAGSVQGIGGTLNIEDPPSFNVLTVDDSADGTARTATLTSFINPSDSQGNSDLWGHISGLAPGAINYEYADTSSATIKTGTGGGTFNVQATGNTTNLIGNSLQAVNVGDTNGVQDILSPLNLSNPPSYFNLTVDDSPDATGRTATISSTAITNLAPAAINYVSGDISSLTVDGGTGGNTFTVTNTPAGLGLGNTPTNLNSGTGPDLVNIQGTAAATTLNVQGQTSGDTVNVTNAGSVQGILGAVNVENTGSFDVLTIDDSADATARTVTLDTFTPGGDTPFQSIAGLAPGTISYEAADVSSATVNAGSGGNTFNVNNVAPSAENLTLNTGFGVDHVNILATGSGSQLNVQGQSGADVVSVTNAGSVQGIMGAVYIENTGSFDALTIDDSADVAGRTATFSTFTPGGDSAWESIAGLAPGVINYEAADITSPTINGGGGGNTFNVNALAFGGLSEVTNLNAGTGSDHVNIGATDSGTTLDVQGEGGTDIVNVGNAGSVQGIHGTLNIENTPFFDTLTIDDSADATARTVALNSFTPGGDTAFESVLGLAPGTINFEVADMLSATINAGGGANVFNINALASAVTGGNSFILNTGAGNDTINVHATDAPTTLSVNTQGGSDTINLDFTSGNPLPHLLNLSGLFTITGLVAGKNLNGTTLNINRSTVYISYGSPLADPIALIKSYLKTGYAAGAWTGTATALTGAINSSPAASNVNHTTAIGYADSADGSGIDAVPNSILLKYTLYGDANLDQQVNSADLQRVLFGLNNPGAWDQGDFNYDGQVNSADLQVELFNLNTVLGSQAAPAGLQASSSTLPSTGTGSTGSKSLFNVRTYVTSGPAVPPPPPHHRHGNHG